MLDVPGMLSTSPYDHWTSWERKPNGCLGHVSCPLLLLAEQMGPCEPIRNTGAH